MIEFPLLSTEDIEVKVKQITKTGALFLLYKTARVDARILDETVGPMNWTNSYGEVKGNLFCKVGIRENPTQDFVYKEDCGIESGQDDGNEKKAEASDAFKRCCSKLGIGRELYTSPQIWASVNTVERGGKWYLEDPYAKYVVTDIKYNEKTRVITELEISNARTGRPVFSWSMPTGGAMAKKMVNTLKNEAKEEDTSSKPEKTPLKTPTEASVAPKAVESSISSADAKKPLKTLASEIGAMVKRMNQKNGNIAAYNAIVREASGREGFKCNVATEDDYDIVLAIHSKLVEAGYNG